MRNVILIGGSGYLGSSVLTALLNKDVRIFGVKNKSEIPQSDKIEIIEGGISSLSHSLIKKINPEYIIHCGRPTFSRLRKVGRKIAAQKAFRLNSTLIDSIQKSNVDTKLLFASGSLAYGNSDKPHNENSDLNPVSYSRQYIKGEMPLVRASAEKDVIVLRFPWLLGNGSWFRWFYLNNIKEFGKIPLFGDGKNIMSIIDVKDAADLMLKYAESSIRNGVYNIFSNDQISQLEFAKTISTIFESEKVPYTKFYPKLEKAAREAFFSNIKLDTLENRILDHYKFQTLEDTLKHIRTISSLKV